MQSKATTVADYLAELPADRREAIQAVRQVILQNLDADYEEGMQYGMIGYYVPHRIYPAGYHCDPKLPLTFAAVASQKNHMAVYMMCFYGSTSEAEWFRKAYSKTGKKLYAVRNEKGEFVDIQSYQRAHSQDIRRGSKAEAAKKAAKKSTAKSVAKKSAAKKSKTKKPAKRKAAAKK